MRDKDSFVFKLKKTDGPLKSDTFIYSIPHTRAKEANGVHRIGGASEWNKQIGRGSCGVAMCGSN